MSLYRTIIPKYTFIPYDFPTSRDGNIIVCLMMGRF